MAEPKRVPDGDRRQQAQHAERVMLVVGVARQQRQAQQAVGGGGVARRDRRVLEVLAAREAAVLVGRGGEEAAPLDVGEALDHLSASVTASRYQRGSNVAS